MRKTGIYTSRNRWLLLPAAGSVLFILMYIVATLYYPGGSQADKAAKGCSRVHNFIVGFVWYNRNVGWFIYVEWRSLFWMGIFNLVLVALNNVLYCNKPLMEALPVVQKITFLSFLCWISLISVGMYRGKITENSV